jgi:hypothetical protein
MLRLSFTANQIVHQIQVDAAKGLAFVVETRLQKCQEFNNDADKGQKLP